MNNNIKKIQEENISFNKDLSIMYKQLENELISTIHSIDTENKKMYLGFEEIAASKLEKNKSDIQLELRNTSNLLSTDIEQVVKNKTEELKADINIKIEKINKRLNIQMGIFTVMFILILVSIFFK
jgi:hypothetical protein